MKRIFRTIQIVTAALLAIVAYNNMYARATAQSEQSVAPVYPAVYLAPDANDSFVKHETKQKYALTQARDQPEVDKQLKKDTKTAVIYIHPEKIEKIDATWLQHQYAKGITVVAINTPISTLAKVLEKDLPAASVEGKEYPVTDLPLRDDSIIVSIIHPVFDELSQDIIGWGWHSNYYPSFDTMPGTVNGLLFSNHKR